MATNIVMPTLGLTMTEGTIETWYVSEGDVVSKGDIVAEIGSEKLTGPVESPVDGIVMKIMVKEGDVLEIKKVMAIVGEEGEIIEDASESSEITTETSVAVAPTASVAERPQVLESERIFVTPLARKMSSAQGINLADVHGTGGNGRITRLDIERYVPSAESFQETSPSAGIQNVDSAEWGVGLAGMRKIIAKRMMRSVQTTAQVTNQRKVDITELMEFRQDLKEKIGQPLTNGELSLNTLVTKAVILSLQKHPEINAWYNSGVHEVKDEIHIGMATDVEEGLVVPVIRDADRMPLSKLGPAIADVASQARKGTLAGDLYSGSTFTITNLGASDIEYFTPIINLPEVAILGVGTMLDELVLDDTGKVSVRKKLPLSFTYDHQIIDGAPASRFLTTLADYLNNPYKLIL